LYRRAQQRKRSKARGTERVEKKERDVIKAHRAYIAEAEAVLGRVRLTLGTFAQSVDPVALARIEKVLLFVRHAERQIDQIRRRVIQGEQIPHDEKVFSLFEPHTEWISKGKAGVPQELGVKVCIVEDQYRFLLEHQVMQKTGDTEVAVPLLERTKREFPMLRQCSFDKGFHSPENKTRLPKILSTVVLPQKGKLSESRRREENEENFLISRRKHAGVESAINALENHGLDRCPDTGLAGFERYVALAVVARNIQTLGTILWKRHTRNLSQKAPLPLGRSA
jgi:hypothetical protein